MLLAALPPETLVKLGDIERCLAWCLIEQATGSGDRTRPMPADRASLASTGRGRVASSADTAEAVRRGQARPHGSPDAATTAGATGRLVPRPGLTRRDRSSDRAPTDQRRMPTGSAAADRGEALPRPTDRAWRRWGGTGEARAGGAAEGELRPSSGATPSWRDLTAALARAEARADRLEAALAEARRPWLARVLEGLRRKGAEPGEETAVTDTDEARRKRSEASRKAAAARSPEARREMARKAVANRDPEKHREAVRKAAAARSPEARREAAMKAAAEGSPRSGGRPR